MIEWNRRERCGIPHPSVTNGLIFSTKKSVYFENGYKGKEEGHCELETQTYIKCNQKTQFQDEDYKLYYGITRRGPNKNCKKRS